LYANVALSKVEARWIPTTDGKKMLTWVILPPNFDENKRYPALLYCQGGPQSAVSQFYSFRWNFQLMAANGYVVVAPNRRGVPGFGKEWNEAISGDWGGQAMKDYLSAIDAVAAEPYVNKEALGAVGASYGGYSVYMLAGIHENRFKALISHCGVFDLKSMYLTTEEMFFANHDIGGPYWKDTGCSNPKMRWSGTPSFLVGSTNGCSRNDRKSLGFWGSPVRIALGSPRVLCTHRPHRPDCPRGHPGRRPPRARFGPFH
jgi:dipeptidyl aminopeptidase/acylaminoacyl peptidase